MGSIEMRAVNPRVVAYSTKKPMRKNFGLCKQLEAYI